ncbi:MAG: tagaturonate reductase [Chitinophagaceae bacterium]|nr:tagaturonate reductase [Chitinophagaceae bacterium]
MYLSRSLLRGPYGDQLKASPEELFSLPEKVLQFGTGVLLRGLPDYYIDKANKQGVFNGRIVVVKSTSSGGADAFDHQQGLYTHVLRGVDKGEVVDKVIINASISRVISAASDWNAVLECATNPDMQVIISNTTEVGITLVEDNIHADPPVSFPGKLLSFLYKRFRHFNGDRERGMVIVPTELITDNGKKLEAIVLELAHQHGLESAFMDWLENANTFCNSLVDRIVPGKLPEDEHQALCKKLGYEDDLLIMSEVYGLWAIETTREKVREVLSFHACDEAVVILPDIHMHRELKLRLLNGSHTFTCGLAYLHGFKTVKEAMQDERFSEFITRLMKQEIVPAIIGNGLNTGLAEAFADKVLDRYRNPFLDHPWINITLQYTGKMAMRNMPILRSYFERYQQVPPAMALGFAAYLLFMNGKPTGEQSFAGSSDWGPYPINDEQAAFFSTSWSTLAPELLVKTILGQTEWWGSDLNQYEGWARSVNHQLARLLNDGPRKVLREYLIENTLA